MAQNQADLCISSWVLTEVASALSLKVRTGQVTHQERSKSDAQIELMRNAFLRRAMIEEPHFFAATRFVARAENLRAGDALHLAIAADYGLKIVTLDKGMAVAAEVLSVDCTLL